MIYSNNKPNTYTESVALFGYDADEFLESVEVALYEDAVAIGENVYDGAEAEAFLAENGIFLYEDHIVLEGKQAEEYKARKAKEKEDKNEAEKKRYYSRYYDNPTTKAMIGYFNNNPDKTLGDARKVASKSNKMNAQKYNDKVGREDARRIDRALSGDKNVKVINHDILQAHDAANRHDRRHKHESTIFDFDLK